MKVIKKVLKSAISLLLAFALIMAGFPDFGPSPEKDTVYAVETDLSYNRIIHATGVHYYYNDESKLSQRFHLNIVDNLDFVSLLLLDNTLIYTLKILNLKI